MTGPNTSAVSFLGRQALRTVQLQYNRDQTGNKNLIVLGLRGEYGKTATFGSWMAKVKNFPYDIIILLTHITHWALGRVKGTSGASIWDSTDHKYSSMTQALKELQASNFPAAPKRPTLMLSMTMSVYLFVSPAWDSWPDSGLNVHNTKIARTVGTGSYVEACQDGDTKKVMPERFMVKRLNFNLQAIYDTNETMIEKLKLVMAEVEKKKGLPPQGWAVFDVEHEDTEKVCPITKTGHDRLEAVKKYLDNPIP